MLGLATSHHTPLPQDGSWVNVEDKVPVPAGSLLLVSFQLLIATYDVENTERGCINKLEMCQMCGWNL